MGWFFVTRKEAEEMDRSAQAAQPKQVSCEKCKCLLWEANAKKVTSVNWASHPLGRPLNVPRIYYYCHVCKPPYDRFCNGKYYKVIPECDVECDKDGYEITTTKG